MAFTNWLPRATRAGGEWNSPNISIPTGINQITIRLNLQSNADFATPDKSITIWVEVSSHGRLPARKSSVRDGWVVLLLLSLGFGQLLPLG
jgi:hypothetical protein